MEVPSDHGLAGTPIPESGMAVLIFPSESVSELVSTAVLDGVGIIGDLIGITTTRYTTTTGTTRGAPHSTTATITIAEEAHAAASTIAPAQPPGLSTETTKLLEATRNPTRRAGRDPAHSAATTAGARQEAIHHAAAPATAVDLTAEEHLTAAAGAGLINRILDEFLVDRKN
jgi:hypothetical protein